MAIVGGEVFTVVGGDVQCSFLAARPGTHCEQSRGDFSRGLEGIVGYHEDRDRSVRGEIVGPGVDGRKRRVLRRIRMIRR